jgi:hypothetical protein
MQEVWCIMASQGFLFPEAMSRVQESVLAKANKIKKKKSKEQVARENHRFWIRHRKELLERSRRDGAKAYARIAAIIREKKDVPCADCKQRFPTCVMDFDHVRGNKSFTIGRAGASKYCTRRVLAEIEKCDVVCANCHRMRTDRRRQELSANRDKLIRAQVAS